MLLDSISALLAPQAHKHMHTSSTLCIWSTSVCFFTHLHGITLPFGDDRQDFLPIFSLWKSRSAVSSSYVTRETIFNRADMARVRKHNTHFVLAIFHEEQLNIQVNSWIMWATTGLVAQRAPLLPPGNFNRLAVMIWHATKWLSATSINTSDHGDHLSHLLGLVFLPRSGVGWGGISQYL